ncbi:DUF3592 domain-containing protein [Bacterioplanoides pacificum]|uniref:DUF3592 domain-containing protein n=1 Tax=Bacterioplanoides pacificum TaxID=1171596 RepID=A0ABV7VRE7_9GAMM
MLYFNSSNTFVSLVLLLPATVLAYQSFKSFSSAQPGAFADGILFLIIFLALISVWAFNILKNRDNARLAQRCTEAVTGVVVSMWDSNLARNERRFVNVIVQYLGRERQIDYVDPNFKYHSPPGSPIALRYNPDNPDDVVIDYSALS